jgi:hypothetical protein
MAAAVMAATIIAAGGSVAVLKSFHFAICFGTSQYLIVKEVAIIKVDFIIKFYINLYCSIGVTVERFNFSIN